MLKLVSTHDYTLLNTGPTRADSSLKCASANMIPEFQYTKLILICYIKLQALNASVGDFTVFDTIKTYFGRYPKII